MSSLFSDPVIRAQQNIFEMLMNVLRILFLNNILHVTPWYTLLGGIDSKWWRLTSNVS